MSDRRARVSTIATALFLLLLAIPACLPSQDAGPDGAGGLSGLGGLGGRGGVGGAGGLGGTGGRGGYQPGCHFDCFGHISCADGVVTSWASRGR